MKKTKLNLKELKVQSFVTSNDSLNTETIKGGIAKAAAGTHYAHCSFDNCSGIECLIKDN